VSIGEQSHWFGFAAAHVPIECETVYYQIRLEHPLHGIVHEHSQQERRTRMERYLDCALSEAVSAVVDLVPMRRGNGY